MKKPPEQINKQKNHENLTNLHFSDRLKKNSFSFPRKNVEA